MRRPTAVRQQAAPLHRAMRRATRWPGRVVGAALAIAAAASASPPATPAEYLARMDADGDGRVSLAEYQAYMSRAFHAMDRDGNGILEGDELPVTGAAPVTLTRYRAALEAAFRRQDRNGDGYLDAGELAAPPR